MPELDRSLKYKISKRSSATNKMKINSLLYKLLKGHMSVKSLCKTVNKLMTKKKEIDILKM